MPEFPTRVLVFMTGRNCEMFVEDAIQSVARQSHPHTQVLFVDDCSDDHTHDLANQLLTRLMPGRHVLLRNASRRGKAYNISVHLREATKNHDVVAVLDADDQLLDPDVLAKLAECYAHGRDVVWTNFVTDRGRLGANKPLDPTQSPRFQGWRTSHLFSFRASLLSNIPEGHFQYPDGRWLDAACDLALSFPILDQTRKYEFLPITAYRYTESNPQSHHNQGPEPNTLNSPKQRICAQVVMSKPELPRVDTPPPKKTDPTVVATTSHWDAACAIALAGKLPGLVPWLADQVSANPDPWLGMTWLNRFQSTHHRNVLILGDGPNASMLSMLTKQADAEAYHLTASAKGDLAAPPQQKRYKDTRWTEYCLENRQAYLPDLAQLPEGLVFDTVLLTPSAFGGRPDLLIALAALTKYLDLASFDLWVEGLTPEQSNSTISEISTQVPELVCTIHRGPASALHIHN